MNRDAVRRALRTFIITTLALFIPGLLGWLNDVTAWAAGNGERPFPDGHGLVFLLVSACVAGVIAVVNLVWNLVEDAAGKGVLRNVPAAKRRDDRGATFLQAILVDACLLAAGFVLALVVALSHH